MSRLSTYVLITPVRNEAQNLPALAACLAAQTLLPSSWIIVDTGSDDPTIDVARDLGRRHHWVRVMQMPGEASAARGGPIVRAFTTGLEAMREPVDTVVKLDADVTMAPDYFQRLVAAFVTEPELGIASGICLENEGGHWLPSYGTRGHVWGAARAYRWDCLRQILPLEERQGWDEIDAIRAQVRGWTTRTLFDLPFKHHRPEGKRDGTRKRWFDQGDTAHFMGYRFSYLVFRTLYRAVREPAALGMIQGYLAAFRSGASGWMDVEARTHLRRQQRLRALPQRLAESLGLRS